MTKSLSHNCLRILEHAFNGSKILNEGLVVNEFTWKGVKIGIESYAMFVWGNFILHDVWNMMKCNVTTVSTVQNEFWKYVALSLSNELCPICLSVDHK